MGGGGHSCYGDSVRGQNLVSPASLEADSR